MSRYSFDRNYADIFRRGGIDVAELLRRSHLPEDLFSRKEIALTQAEYFGLIEQLGLMDTDGTLAERIATAESLETLIPPMFAAYCSRNGLAFLHRFATYKRLIGPMKLLIAETDDTVEVELCADSDEQPLPPFFAKLEMRFMVSVLGKATQTDIRPVAQTEDGRYALTFSAADLQRPFVTRNDAMWSYFEPELRRRLSEMEIDDSMAARVRSSLVELLPAGKTTIDDVASKLCLSRRTLQRKLADEGTTFQQQLNSTRLLLAQNYLKNGDRTTDDIAFLLGYEDTTSFLRAFNAWTGKTVTEYKRNTK